MTNDAMGRRGSGAEYGAYHAGCGGGILGGEFLGGVGGSMPCMPSLSGLSGFTCRNTHGRSGESLGDRVTRRGGNLLHE